MWGGVMDDKEKDQDQKDNTNHNEERIAIARNLKSMNLDINSIVRATGLTQDEIDAI